MCARGNLLPPPCFLTHRVALVVVSSDPVTAFSHHHTNAFFTASHQQSSPLTISQRLSTPPLPDGKNQRSLCMRFTPRCTHSFVSLLPKWKFTVPGSSFGVTSSSQSRLEFSSQAVPIFWQTKVCQAAFAHFYLQPFHFMHLDARCVNILHFSMPKPGVRVCQTGYKKSCQLDKKPSGLPL